MSANLMVPTESFIFHIGRLDYPSYHHKNCIFWKTHFPLTLASSVLLGKSCPLPHLSNCCSIFYYCPNHPMPWALTTDHSREASNSPILARSSSEKSGGAAAHLIRKFYFVVFKSRMGYLRSATLLIFTNFKKDTHTRISFLHLVSALLVQVSTFRDGWMRSYATCKGMKLKKGSGSFN